MERSTQSIFSQSGSGQAIDISGSGEEQNNSGEEKEEGSSGSEMETTTFGSGAEPSTSGSGLNLDTPASGAGATFTTADINLKDHLLETTVFEIASRPATSVAETTLKTKTSVFALYTTAISVSTIASSSNLAGGSETVGFTNTVDEENSHKSTPTEPTLDTSGSFSTRFEANKTDEVTASGTPLGHLRTDSTLSEAASTVQTELYTSTSSSRDIDKSTSLFDVDLHTLNHTTSPPITADFATIPLSTPEINTQQMQQSTTTSAGLVPSNSPIQSAKPTRTEQVTAFNDLLTQSVGHTTVATKRAAATDKAVTITSVHMLQTTPNETTDTLLPEKRTILATTTDDSTTWISFPGRKTNATAVSNDVGGTTISSVYTVITMREGTVAPIHEGNDLTKPRLFTSRVVTFDQTTSITLPTTTSQSFTSSENAEQALTSPNTLLTTAQKSVSITPEDAQSQLNFISTPMANSHNGTSETSTNKSSTVSNALPVTSGIAQMRDRVTTTNVFVTGTARPSLGMTLRDNASNLITDSDVTNHAFTLSDTPTASSIDPANAFLKDGTGAMVSSKPTTYRVSGSYSPSSQGTTRPTTLFDQFPGETTAATTVLTKIPEITNSTINSMNAIDFSATSIQSTQTLTDRSATDFIPNIAVDTTTNALTTVVFRITRPSESTNNVQTHINSLSVSPFHRMTEAQSTGQDPPSSTSTLPTSATTVSTSKSSTTIQSTAVPTNSVSPTTEQPKETTTALVTTTPTTATAPTTTTTPIGTTTPTTTTTPIMTTTPITTTTATTVTTPITTTTATTATTPRTSATTTAATTTTSASFSTTVGISMSIC